ncbi:organic cation/carnitine transporter 1 [Coffea eugenioides]|uniref:organic cation/carnitine transporter 1 n=1 Tax=Coffea eugenioides TaxID=49369 RepID=UPI000F615DF5|nr:organic cation/carnitine transporter 1 [Coffea eugenioides]
MEEEKNELLELSSAEKGFCSSKSLGSEKLELTVDQVIEEYVGSFGFSQLLHVFLVSLAWIFDAQSTLVTIFADAQPDGWRCISSSSSSSCRLTNISSGDAASVCGLKPGTWEWMGGNTSSTIAEWGLICDRKFLAAMPASFYFLGSLVGASVYGYLADAFLGRKRAVLISCLLTSITIFLTSLSPNIWLYSLLRFANGFSRSGIGICSLVLTTEVVGVKWRGQAGQYGFFFFAVGFVSIPLIAYPSRNSWRSLYKIISFLPLVYSIFVLLPFVSESPRWLLVRGRSKEALDVLRRYARLNGRKIPPNLCISEPSVATQETSKGEEVLQERTLWNTKWAAKRMALVMMTGFGIGFVYFGVQLNVENLNFNLYFAVAANAMMEISAVFIGGVLLSVAKRRLIFSQLAFIAGLSSILCILFSGGKQGILDKSGGSWPEFALEAIEFMAASTAFNVLFVYTLELFPTNVRSFAVSVLRQAMVLGASIAPLLVAVGRYSPALAFLIFGALSIFSGLMILWLPETRNSPLYETLEQQDQEGQLNSAPNHLETELSK